MRLIEVLLRLGCGMVAWMVIYTHCIWTATLFVTGCEADGDNLWRLLLGFAPFTLGFCLLLNVTQKLTEVHKIIIWLSVPLVLFVPLSLRAIWPSLINSTFDGMAICAGDAPADWHFWWAPVQLFVTAAIVVAVARVWILRQSMQNS